LLFKLSAITLNYLLEQQYNFSTLYVKILQKARH